MWDIVLFNLQNAAIGLLLFVLAYVSNMCFSIYYNIRILHQEFDKQRLIDSGFKILAFGLGTILLVVAITSLPLFATQVGYVIPSEYEELLSNLTILAVFIVATCRYALEAFAKLKLILFVDTKIKEVEPG